MNLDLSSFEKAVGSLQMTLAVADDRDFMSGLSDSQKNVIRARVIQNFEFTYELCWKFMRRWLDANLGSTYVEGVTRRQLFRLSAENKLIGDVDKWMEYHEARNETAHTYDENTAEEVFKTAREFIADAERLLKALEDRND
jgi:nucleotidyltransferase substrate binding protein (TIGR01987 family)